MPVRAPEHYEIAKSADRTVIVSFDTELEAGETLSGTPVFTELNGTSYLTFTLQQLNTAAIDVKGNTVAASRAALAQVTSDTADVDVEIRVSCATSTGQNVVAIISLSIAADGT